jgi:broad specificity phosphatase PhoE
MKQIHFIRHAQSLGNIGQRTKDIQSIDLSEHGYKQANDLIHQIPYVPDLIIHSPYIRTKLTAQPTIDHHNITNIQEWDDVKELTYLCAIKWAYSNHDERQPVIDKYWSSCDPHYRDGESETFSETFERMKSAMKKLEEIEAEKILVFTHGQFLQMMRLYLMYGDNTQEIMSRFREMDKKHPIENVGIYTYETLVKI